MELTRPTIADADALADCWVALAADQRQYGSRLLPEDNREAVAEIIAQHIVTDGLLVARESAAGSRGTGSRGTGSRGAGGPGGPRVDEDSQDPEWDGGSQAHGGDGAPHPPRESSDSRTTKEPGSSTASSESGEILGFVMYRVEDGRYLQDRRTGVIVNLYVRPAARNEGIGSQLLAAAESELAAEGVDTVTLEVLAANDAARRFYARHGYDAHRVELAKRIESDTHSKDDP